VRINAVHRKRIKRRGHGALVCLFLNSVDIDISTKKIIGRPPPRRRVVWCVWLFVCGVVLVVRVHVVGCCYVCVCVCVCVCSKLAFAADILVFILFKVCMYMYVAEMQRFGGTSAHARTRAHGPARGATPELRRVTDTPHSTACGLSVSRQTLFHIPHRPPPS